MTTWVVEGRGEVKALAESTLGCYTIAAMKHTVSCPTTIEFRRRNLPSTRSKILPGYTFVTVKGKKRRFLLRL